MVALPSTRALSIVLVTAMSPKRSVSVCWNKTLVKEDIISIPRGGKGRDRGDVGGGGGSRGPSIFKGKRCDRQSTTTMITGGTATTAKRTFQMVSVLSPTSMM